MMTALASSPVHVMVDERAARHVDAMAEILQVHDAVRQEQRVATAAADQREHDQPVGRPAHHIAEFPGRRGDVVPAAASRGALRLGPPLSPSGCRPMSSGRSRTNSSASTPATRGQRRRSPTSPRASYRRLPMAQGRMYLIAK